MHSKSLIIQISKPHTFVTILIYFEEIYTCSTDLNDRTSFRIDRIDGEFDKICRSLGLYGPEDFAIPAAAWEAKKFRSSSDIGRLRYSRCCMSEKCQDRDRDEVAETVVIGGAGGINGIRPPMIKPPPLMRVWVVDNSESLQRRREKAGSGSGGDAAGAGDNSVSSEEGELVISPNQRIKPGCWQKGVLLWRGSFASVYEGCTE
ncbi:hypothetical protein TSUD_417640 [Trifolium subterraneum]|uniref:Uncharacterized protein n=1 Tax=Trifolium subterraneum TaxID=3900 RepID=A0A2Z6P6G7_TRISU|nr:hypothetical protein TSUD_417640 [Trifolium subterraneum]